MENNDWQTVETTPLGLEKKIKDSSGRLRWALPTYDVSSGENLETPINMDNSLLQVMFPEAEIALGQVPAAPPPYAKAEKIDAHWQAALEDLTQDLESVTLDIATGGRKEGRFLFTDSQAGRLVADTHEKIMAYGGLLASPCLQPPKLLEDMRVLVVPEGEMGTGDCAGKISTELLELWGKDESHAGQFRLGVRPDEDTILIGKGTLKQMEWTDVDKDGQGYDLILPDSSFKGNMPQYGEHTWDLHLGFNGWSGERRAKVSYQILQWFPPELVEQCVLPRAEAKIPILLEAMKSAEGAREFLKLEREERSTETHQNERGELEVKDREPTVLEDLLLADTTGAFFDHPYIQRNLRRRLRQAWHDLAVGGGVKIPSFLGLPDSFGGTVDWLPEGTIVCPDLPPGEVLATRYPIRTKHDVQVWQNVDWKTVQELGLKVGLDERTLSRFFRYARKHQGVVFMSHDTAKRLGGDFDGDQFQIMPVTPHKPLAEIENPNRDWSDLAPLVDHVRSERWGEGEITPKVKHRLATHVAPEQPKKVTADNRKWLASAAIQQGNQREQFLVDLGHHLDTQALTPEEKRKLAEALTTIAADPGRSLDEAVEIAETHGFDFHGWTERHVEGDPFDLARRYNREQAARQALKNTDSTLGQIVYTVSRVNASDRYTPEEKERTIKRLAEELQAEVDKFKYDTAADMDFVDAVRQEVGRELVWLDVHKDPDLFVAETRLSPSGDGVSPLWNHVSRRFRAWERATQPPRHFKDAIAADFTEAQFKQAQERVNAYNKAIARSIQRGDDKGVVSAIQNLESWSEGYTDPQERRAMAQAVWHAAHESVRVGGSASAAFHAFRPEMFDQVASPQPLPAREIAILGAQHENNLGKSGIALYDEPQTVRLQVLLEDYTNTYGQTERRLAAYELDQAGSPAQRIGYLPKDAPRQEGSYLANLHRPVNTKGKRGRIEGTLSPLQEYKEGGSA